MNCSPILLNYLLLLSFHHNSCAYDWLKHIFAQVSFVLTSPVCDFFKAFSPTIIMSFDGGKKLIMVLIKSIMKKRVRKCFSILTKFCAFHIDVLFSWQASILTISCYRNMGIWNRWISCCPMFLDGFTIVSKYHAINECIVVVFEDTGLKFHSMRWYLCFEVNLRMAT